MTNTVAMCWVHFARAPSELYLATGADSATVTFELKSQAANASLGDVAGQTIVGMDFQVGDGSTLTYAQITGADGAQVIRVLGGERISAGGQSQHSNMNMCVAPLSIPVVRGMTLNVLTLD